MLRLLDWCLPAYTKAGQGKRFRMFGPRIRRVSARVWDALPGLLLVPPSLLTVVWLSPDVPYPLQDSAWVLALNQAVANRLAFGRDVGFSLGPWGNVYTGQYHPATDGMMLFGGAVVALALASGLSALARGGRRWLVLLAPLLSRRSGYGTRCSWPFRCCCSRSRSSRLQGGAADGPHSPCCC